MPELYPSLMTFHPMFFERRDMHHTFHCADAIFWHIDMAKSQQHDETQQPRWLRYVSRPCFFFRVERKRLQITRKWLHPALANQATKFGNKKTQVGSDVTPNPCGRIERVWGKMLLFWRFERPQSLGTLPLGIGGCYWTQRPPKKNRAWLPQDPKLEVISCCRTSAMRASW